MELLLFSYDSYFIFILSLSLMIVLQSILLRSYQAIYDKYQWGQNAKQFVGSRQQVVRCRWGGRISAGVPLPNSSKAADVACSTAPCDLTRTFILHFWLFYLHFVQHTLTFRTLHPHVIYFDYNQKNVINLNFYIIKLLSKFYDLPITND